MRDLRSTISRGTLNIPVIKLTIFVVVDVLRGVEYLNEFVVETKYGSLFSHSTHVFVKNYKKNLYFFDSQHGIGAPRRKPVGLAM